MNYLPLRARGVRGELTNFTIQDCPRLYNQTLFYLSKKNGTPLLQPTTIMFGSDLYYENGELLYEGDVVRHKETGKVYVVEFYTDFYLRSLTNEKVDKFTLSDFSYAGMYYDYETIADIIRKQNPHRIARYKKAGNEDAKFSLFQILFTGENELSFFYQPNGEDKVMYSNLYQKLMAKGIYGEYLYLGETKYNLFQIIMKDGRIYYSYNGTLYHHSEKEKLVNIVKNVSD